MLVAATVLFAVPPMFDTSGAGLDLNMDVEAVALDDLERPDGDGLIAVAMVLPWKTDGSVIPRC